MKNRKLSHNNCSDKRADTVKFLSVFLFSSLLLLVTRVFLYKYIGCFGLTVSLVILTVGMTVFFRKKAVSSSGKNDQGYDLSKFKATASAALVFASGVLISIPLLYLGDYIGTKANLVYDTTGIFGNGFVMPLLFAVAIPSILIELVLRRTVYNLLADRFGGLLSYLVVSLFVAVYFMDLTVFLSVFVMAGILTAIDKISKNTGVSLSCSLVWGMIMYFFNYMLSLDGDGVENLGIIGILGMLLTFSSVAFGIIYCVHRGIKKRKSSLVEIATVIILIALSFILGCIFTAI